MIFVKFAFLMMPMQFFLTVGMVESVKTAQKIFLKNPVSAIYVDRYFCAKLNKS